MKDEVLTFLESITDVNSLRANGFFPMKFWGKDHWSLLAYLFTVAVDNKSEVNYNKLRINNNKRPPIGRFFTSWQDSYSTRLSGYWHNGVANPNLQIIGHDDVDCMQDMEAEGVIVCGTYTSGIFRLTDKGIALANELMTYKVKGGNFADFKPSKKMLGKD